jgi:hypothetical protein
MKEVGVLTKNWRIFQGKRGIDSTQSGMESGIFRPAYHTKFHSRTKIPLCIFTYLQVCRQIVELDLHSSTTFWWHFVAPHNDAAILVQRMLFSFCSCVIILPDIQQMSSVLKSGRKWPYASAASCLAYCKPSSCIPPRGEFCALHLMTKFLCKQFSFHLSHTCSHSQRYNRQGMYGKVRENGRLWREHHVVGLLLLFQWWVFVPPKQWRNSCAKDSLFVCLTCVSTPKGTIVQVYIDSW